MVRVRAMLVVALTACGRLGFEHASEDANGDGRQGDAIALTTYRDVVMQDLPLAYWRLGANPGRDETGQFDATIAGNCTPVAAPLVGDADTALHFNGSSCFGSIASGLEFPGNAPFSVELWLRDERNDIYQVLWIKETRMGMGPLDGYGILSAPQGMYLERIVNTAGQTTDPQIIPTNQWLDIVATYDGVSLRMFIDGLQVGPAKTGPEVMPAVPIAGSFGSFPAGNTFLQGDMDEIAIYDHALSPERIAKHHMIAINGPQSGQ